MDPTVRRIFSSGWEERAGEAGALLVYRVRGSGFLHHMVRNLVGTMLDVGRGRLRADSIAGDSGCPQPVRSRTDRPGAGAVSSFGGVRRGRSESIKTE